MSACWKSKPPWPEGFRRRIGSSLYSAGARHPASFNAFVQVPPKKDRVCDYILLIQYIYIYIIYIYTFVTCWSLRFLHVLCCSSTSLTVPPGATTLKKTPAPKRNRCE